MTETSRYCPSGLLQWRPARQLQNIPPVISRVLNSPLRNQKSHQRLIMNKDRILQEINCVEEILKDVDRNLEDAQRKSKDAQVKLESLRAELQDSAENPDKIMMDDNHESPEINTVQDTYNETDGSQEEIHEGSEDDTAGNIGREVSEQREKIARDYYRKVEGCVRLHDRDGGNKHSSCPLQDE